MNRFFRVASCLLLLVAPAAWSVPITYTYSGTGTGSLNGVGFTDQSFSIVATADTANIANWPDGGAGSIQNTHTSASIDINGFPHAAFTEATHTWHGLTSTGGLGRNLDANLITINEAGWFGYDLDTNITVNENAPLDVDQFSNVSTDLGDLSFSSIQVVRFTALLTQVPVPGTLLLLGLGVAGLGWSRRRV
jgi:hypothetical protein